MIKKLGIAEFFYVLETLKKESDVDNQQLFSNTDRGLAYGDGFFTTALVRDGNVDLWPLHRKRLVECQQRLGFPVLRLVEIESLVQEQVKDKIEAVLKILITRGEGGRGYQAPETPQPSVSIQVLPFPSHYTTWQQNGIEVALSRVKLGIQPLLAGLKTLNRLEQVLIKQDAQTLVCDDVIVTDINDRVIEASAANIIMIKENNLYTPDLSGSGIKGVFLTALESKHDIRVKNIAFDELKAADGVFICNSLMQLVPVVRIENKHFDIVDLHDLKRRFLGK
ncbi:aminodeoxychorismate lyase [Pseudoalteromonas piscicida]|uniref:Aminodeoxychorismate lyase n=1 Tax=Pseudoalteromonas piscicida TaxID=43662 RepID=A0AAQ2IT76_PSEO7|nr:MULTISPECIES: aminodeoxychorismate lyase [Pseudoalteromonas]KJY88967.1 4-amino-4-deoxychorismate lyase [Pseudoalteromonas piscicida]MDP4487431.1 aminodeoxychorismate lyase [Pseudoalteromonas piscicida]TMN37912.1 aminodeoxychorismate lyase [Pseudoalteromonas piscicida]TMN41248.1 aminodeoxychorismate lyase [Pseudoalteromonas piscicida]TMN53365.1 aminodeoxychorismate lyase [Pseudoalteromonas piscicida]